MAQETTINSCLSFWDEAWWFLSLRVFGQLSSSLLLFLQRFSRYVLRPSSGEGFRVRQTPEEGRRTYRQKRCGNNIKNENNSPKTLNDKIPYNVAVAFFVFLSRESLIINILNQATSNITRVKFCWIKDWVFKPNFKCFSFTWQIDNKHHQSVTCNETLIVLSTTEYLILSLKFFISYENLITSITNRTKATKT